MNVKIRRQSIISSIVIYLGFGVGFLNAYFFTKHGTFSTDQYGLITLITSSVAPLMASLANLAMPSYIYKFHPYYNDNLEPDRNDMFTWAVLINLGGFAIIALLGWAIAPLVVQKYSEKSPLFVEYYYWSFLMGLGLALFNVLEAYAWSLQKSVLTNYLKEAQWRLFTTVIIVLFVFKIIPNFGGFIKLYSLSYISVSIALFAYLLFTHKVRITLVISKVTRRFLKKIARFCFFIYSANLVFTLAAAFDIIVIAAAVPNGASKAAIFGLAQIMTSVIQAPQRGIISASIPHLSQAWKNKNLVSIKKIYQRSSLNMLIVALGLFVLIVLNYTDAIKTLHLNNEYLLGFEAFIFLGLTRVVDMGTGVNAQIIGTSNYWKFELVSGLVLLVLVMPLTYFLAITMDMLGPAIAQLISISVYNAVRIVFLYKKYKLFPFTKQSLYALLLAAGSFIFCYALFHEETGWISLFARSICAITLLGGSVFAFRISPDVTPIVQSILCRINGNKKEA